MNLVIPIGYNSTFFNIEDYGYPKPLIEIMGVPMIQYVIKNITKDVHFNKIIFIVKQDECDKFHLDNTLNLLSPIRPEIIKLRSDTQGALCSVYLQLSILITTSLCSYPMPIKYLIRILLITLKYFPVAI